MHKSKIPKPKRPYRVAHRARVLAAVQGGKLTGGDLRVTVQDAVALGDTPANVRRLITTKVMPAYKAPGETSAYSFWLSDYLAAVEGDRVQP